MPLLEQNQDASNACTETKVHGADLAKNFSDITDLLEKDGDNELLKIPGLGPKRAKVLFKESQIQTLDQLSRAARDGRIATLPGFGKTLEKKLLEAASSPEIRRQRFKLPIVKQYAEEIISHLNRATGALKVSVAGSLRRSKETLSDLDIVVSAKKRNDVIKFLTKYREVEKVLLQGPTRGSVLLRFGIRVDLKVVEPENYAGALQYFTGSKAHNLELQKLARAAGLTLNEHGLFRGKKRISGRSEESIYHELGLPYIPPELRENKGEIEAALADSLPILVEPCDIRGDLHCHTKASDGRNSLEEMAIAAKMLNYQYLAITDHVSGFSFKGLDADGLYKQLEAIDLLNHRIQGIKILKGVEVDILEDGSLGLPDSILSKLDLVIASIHSKFHLTRQKQTTRLIQAMKNKYLTIIGHPTSKLTSEQEPYDVDMSVLIQEAAKYGVFLELNAHPDRLEIMETPCRLARNFGVLVSIASDAHSINELDLLQHGIGQARRGWLEKDHVLNSRSLSDLLQLLN